jgi:glycosyltransferase involved in cell wall biosynthesis
MRVLYDGTIFNSQPYGGINRYFCNLISELPKDWTPLLTTCETYKERQPEHPNLKVNSCQLGFRPRRISNWLRYNYFKLIYNSRNFDLVHPTYYSLLNADDLSHCPSPMVLTVWDMIHELFPAQIDPNGYEAAMKRKAILSAQAIICISENTKCDLLKFFDIPEENVHVTYLASDLDIQKSWGTETVPNQPYFLYVGRRHEYKNLKVVLKAMSKLITLHPDVQLCLVGLPLEAKELSYFDELKITSNVKYYGLSNDNQLAKLYRCSIAFIYPSLYEGFGIPPLEAMGCGTAVIASNASSIPEVVGNGGLLFNPYSEDELLDQMLFLLENPLKRESLIQKGIARNSQFQWGKTVEQTLEVYKKFA